MCDRITNHYVNITCNPPCPITNRFVPWPNNFVRLDVARNRLVDTIVHVAVRSILASGFYPQTPATVQLKLPSFSRFVHSSPPPIRHMEFDPIEDESTISITLTTSSLTSDRPIHLPRAPQLKGSFHLVVRTTDMMLFEWENPLVRNSEPFHEYNVSFSLVTNHLLHYHFCYHHCQSHLKQ